MNKLILSVCIIIASNCFVYSSAKLNGKVYTFYSDSTKDLNYINYHQLINKAEIGLYNREPKESQKLYLEAFKKYPKPFSKDLINACIVSLVNKDRKMANELLAKCFKLGVPLEIILNKKIIKRQIGKQNIKRSFTLNHKITSKIPERKSIDSLLLLDRTYRIQNKDLQELDKSISLFLLEYLIHDRFPGEYLIGYHPTLFLLFHHNPTFWSEEKQNELLKEEFIKGNVHPILISLIKDRNALFKTLFKERYYYLPYDYIKNGKLITNSSILPIDNFINEDLLNIINERRNAIGLKSVEDGQKLNEKKFRKKYQLYSYKYI